MRLSIPSAVRAAAFVFIVSTSLSGCLLEAPDHDPGGPLAAALTPIEPAAVFADGAARFVAEIRADEATRDARGEVELAVVGGAFVGGEPTLATRIPASGVVVVEVVAGRQPGPLMVEARIDGFVARSPALELAPRSPDAIELVLDAPVLAPGASTALEVILTADEPGAAPSWGTVVRFAVCCDEGGAPTACGVDPAPLRMPPRATLIEGDALRVSVDAVDGAEGDVVGHVVAAAGRAPDCADAASAAVTVIVR